MRMRQAMVVGLLAALGCSADRQAGRHGDDALSAVAGPGLVVTLSWETPVDLDLYVSDPAAETAYFGNRQTHAGTRLVHASECSDARPPTSQFREVADMPRVLHGHFRVGVDYLESCDHSTAEPVPFRVLARLGDSVVAAAGEARLDTFNDAVIEFEVAGDPPRLRLAAPAPRAAVLPAPRGGGLGE